MYGHTQSYTYTQSYTCQSNELKHVWAHNHIRTHKQCMVACHLLFDQFGGPRFPMGNALQELRDVRPAEPRGPSTRSSRPLEAPRLSLQDPSRPLDLLGEVPRGPSNPFDLLVEAIEAPRLVFRGPSTCVPIKRVETCMGTQSYELKHVWAHAIIYVHNHIRTNQTS
jgi:hypothetical protein